MKQAPKDNLVTDTTNYRSSIVNMEAVRSRRRARFYRYRIVRLLNILLIITVIAVLYLYRHPIYIVTREIGNSYAFVAKVAVDLYGRLSGFLNLGVNAVEIKGIRRIQKSEIIEQIYTVTAKGMKLHASIHTMKDNIAKIPLVKRVIITRDIVKGKICIQVIEKNIIGLVKRSFRTDILMLDDERGLQPVNDYMSRLIDVPIVENIEYSDGYMMLYLYMNEKAIFDRLSKAVFVSNRRWDLYFKNNLLVKLPAKSWQEALDLLVRVDEKINVLSDFNKIEYIDLRAHGKIFLK